MKRVLVTGASGFIGKHVCETLLRRGWVVRAGVRSKAAAVNLPKEIEQVEISDIGPDTDWRAPLKNVDNVVHLAGLAHVLKAATESTEAFYRVNTGGTESLARACSSGAVQRIVFISSIAAVGVPPSGYISESEQPAPLDAYGRSKLAAERALQAAALSGLETVVLRPPLVYGPGVSANFLRMLRAVHSRWPLPLGACTSPRSLLYVLNLADIVDCALTTPGISGQLFHVADQETVSTRELVLKLAAFMGQHPHLLNIPTRVLRLGGTILGKSYEIDRLIRSYVVPATQWRQRTGWSQPYQLDDALQHTTAWFLRQVRAV